MQARLAAENGEVPIGAVIVKNDDIIACGRNRKEELKNALSHAEMNLLTAAAETLGDWRLTDCTLYVTAEPCIMCAGAIMHARVKRVIFGVTEPKFGGVVSNASVFDTLTLNHRVEWLSGICKDEIAQMMKEFFSNLRKQATS